MYKDASLQEGRRNKVMKIKTFPYVIFYASDIASLPLYLLPNKFLIPVAYPQCKTAFENTFFLTQTFWNYSFKFERAEEFCPSMAALTGFGSVVLFPSQA